MTDADKELESKAIAASAPQSVDGLRGSFNFREEIRNINLRIPERAF